MPQANKQIRIGTSNIVLPVSKPGFPPEYRSGSRLAYYASLFDTVEINSSFYRVPQFGTFARWAADVPAGFRFSVKLWKGITHIKKLDFSEGDVIAFLEAAAGLGNKRGCLLVQFPASVTVELFSKVEQLLQLLTNIDKKRGWYITVEFRHNSWYIAEMYELLDELGCSVVLHDMKGSETTFLNGKAKAVYVRFHGTAPNYGGSYSAEELRKTGKRADDWLKKGKEVYVYFNNTLGEAFRNAGELRKITDAKRF